jgi:hypothetical protein
LSLSMGEHPIVIRPLFLLVVPLCRPSSSALVFADSYISDSVMIKSSSIVSFCLRSQFMRLVAYHLLCWTLESLAQEGPFLRRSEKHQCLYWVTSLTRGYAQSRLAAVLQESCLLLILRDGIVGHGTVAIWPESSCWLETG